MPKAPTPGGKKKPLQRGPPAPTIVKVHEAKTHLSRLLQQVARGGRVLIANGNQGPGFELVPVRPVHHAARRFGSLRGVVAVDRKFFEPLAATELAAWEG